ncbi:IclR family transcriptional regulator [Nocardioides sp. LS1]|uniref:IclR family transcriptional regulator n=1 Tax=Nocardioides sp. LS1 TaxID=1027620 RepID=UPI000FFADE6B|nr:IclR family transcriptional regulator [Nocardioides sp. LS1]GCD88628.1 IclR family transcriptional regulator [Nocardioides sp. LS1]
MTAAIEEDDTDSRGVRDDRAAVDKAVSLLLAFGEHASSGVGVSELARRSGLSKSTAFRVLGLLERNGVVERVGRQYRLGERLHELGRHVYSPEHDRVRDSLTPFVTELYGRTHDTVHLATLHGTDVVYLAKLYGHRQVPSPSRIGGRVAAHGTAVGKALLAHDASALKVLLGAPLPSLTPATLTDPDALCEQLATVRQLGVAYDLEEVQPGLFCVATPILSSAGRPIAALSVSVASFAALGPAEAMLRQVAGDASRFVRHGPLARRRLRYI